MTSTSQTRLNRVPKAPISFQSIPNLQQALRVITYLYPGFAPIKILQTRYHNESWTNDPNPFNTASLASLRDLGITWVNILITNGSSSYSPDYTMKELGYAE